MEPGDEANSMPQNLLTYLLPLEMNRYILLSSATVLNMYERLTVVLP